MRVLWMGTHSFWVNRCSSWFPTFYGTLPGRYYGWVCYPILRWPNNIFTCHGRPNQLFFAKSFKRLKQFGVKIKAFIIRLRCHLFKKKISYLGRLVPSESYTADPKIKLPPKTHRVAKYIRFGRVLVKLPIHCAPC